MIEESTAPNQPRVDAVTKWLVRELSHISQEALTTNGPFRLKALSRALADGIRSTPLFAGLQSTMTKPVTVLPHRIPRPRKACSEKHAREQAFKPRTSKQALSVREAPTALR